MVLPPGSRKPVSNLAVLLLPALACSCFGLAVVVIGGAIYLYVRRGVDDINRTWGELGLTTGLTLKPAAAFSQPELTGTYRQRPLHLYTYSVGTHDNRTVYTAITLAIAGPSGASLEITPASSIGNVLGRMIKAQDVQIGDPAFDGRFVIKSDPPEFAARVLGDDRLRARVGEIPAAFRIAIEPGNVEYSRRGLEEDAQLLVRLFNVLSDLADQIEQTSPQPAG